MHFAYVVEEYPRPSETFIRREVETMRTLGHRVSVWPCGHRVRVGESPWIGPDAQDATRAMPLAQDVPKLTDPWAPISSLRYDKRIDRAAEQAPKDIDLVHAHFASLPAFCAFGLATLLSRPWTVSVHARDIFAPWRPGLRAARRAARVIACSQEAAHAAKRRGVAPERLRMIHHGVSEDFFSARHAPEGPPTVFAAGRLVPKKGFNTLIHALPVLRGQVPEARVRIAGEGPLAYRLKEASYSLGVGDSVAFLGRIKPEDVLHEMCNAHVLCAPSIVFARGDRDGIPNVVVEAMAVGLPVVASRVGGLPEVVEDGVTGRLVTPDRHTHLAAVLAELLRDPPQGAQLAQAAHARVRDEFNLERNVRVLAAYLEEVAAR